MIRAIDKREVPPVGGKTRSEARQFAFEAVGEFLEKAGEGDVYEVTGYPEVPAETKLSRASKIVQAIRTELWHFGKQRDVKVYRRRERIFLELPVPTVITPAKPRNPYPGDLPKI